MHPNRRTGLALTLLSISLGACSAPPKLQPPPLTFGGIGGNDGTTVGVKAIARGADGTTYFGGSFTSVSVTTGSGLALDGGKGLPKGAFPKVEGEVKVVVPDGKSGWYIGGAFRSVGGLERKNLAHLSADSTVDPAWTPSVDGPVYAIALLGGLVYVGGDFHNVGTVARRNLAAIDASGNLTAWDPGASGRFSPYDTTLDVSKVYALAVNGSSIYVGGDFTTVGGGAHTGLAVVTNAGAADAWIADTAGVVRALLVTATNLYVGGEFTAITTSDGSSTERNGLASFTLDGKLDAAWNPSPVASDQISAKVYALAAGSGNTLYVGGSFMGFASGGGGGGGGGAVAGGGGGGTTGPTTIRSGVAALDASGKVIADWDPALSVGGDTPPVVRALAVSGSTLYVGGTFITSRGTSRTFGVAVDGTSGLPTDWNPGFDGAVEALATRGDTVFAGGAFLGLRATPRNRLAAIAADGTLSDWNPSIPSGYVGALAVVGDIIYVGGQFQSIGGQGRANLAAVDKKGVVQTWNPGATFSSFPEVGRVDLMGIGPDAIYIGGVFDKVGNATRTNLASVDSAGQVTEWNPVDVTGYPTALLVSGSSVYCSGQLNGSSGTAWGLFHYTAPSATSDWSLAMESSSAKSLALVSQNQPDSAGGTKVVTTLLAGGDFSKVGASGPANLAAIDVDTHEVSTVVLVPAVDQLVDAVAVADGTVYIGGDFSNVTSPGGSDAEKRAAVAAFDLATGTVKAWHPDVYTPYGPGLVVGLVPVSGGVDILGTFTSVDATIGSGIARVSR